MKNTIRIKMILSTVAAFLAYSPYCAAGGYAGRDISGKSFNGTDLRGVDFSGATIKNASFVGADFSASQLYSTASYKRKDLGAIRFVGALCRSFMSPQIASLCGWDFSGQNMPGARFEAVDIDGANFSGANLSGASIFDSFADGADFSNANLQNAAFGNSRLPGADITNSNFSGCDMRGVLRGVGMVMWSHKNNTIRNLISESGVIYNFGMESAADNLVVRKYEAPDGTINLIGATLDAGSSCAMTGGTLTLEDEACFFVNGALTLKDGGNLKINLSTKYTAAPMFVNADAGGSFNVEGGNISVNVGGDYEKGDTATLVTGAEEGIMKAFEDSLAVTFNGRRLANDDWSLNFNSGNVDLKILAIPEPAAMAAMFGAFALAFAAAANSGGGKGCAQSGRRQIGVRMRI